MFNNRNSFYGQAFNCISTGIYGFPNDRASEIALDEVRKFMDSSNGSNLDLVLFCMFALPSSVLIYECNSPNEHDDISFLQKDWDLYLQKTFVVFIIPLWRDADLKECPTNPQPSGLSINTSPNSRRNRCCGRIMNERWYGRSDALALYRGLYCPSVRPVFDSHEQWKGFESCVL